MRTIIPSHFTTQMDMLKSGENNNQAANPPGYLLSDIKRRSLSSLLDRIPSKKEPEGINIKITFIEDGAERFVKMIQPDSEDGIWIPQDYE